MVVTTNEQKIAGNGIRVDRHKELAQQADAAASSAYGYQPSETGTHGATRYAPSCWKEELPRNPFNPLWMVFREDGGGLQSHTRLEAKQDVMALLSILGPGHKADH